MKNQENSSENSRDSGRNPGFGPKKTQNIWDKLVGKWVLLYPSSRPGNNFGGFVQSIDEGDYAILNPIQAGKTDRWRYTDLGLRNRTAGVYLPGSSYEVTTKENLENACILNNKKNDEARKGKKIILS